MDITKRMLGVFELIAVSLKTFLRVLPSVLLVYIVPMLLILFFNFSHITQFFKVLYAVDPKNKEQALSLLAELLARPQLWLAVAASILVYIYSVAFIFKYTEGVLNKEKDGFTASLVSALASLPRLICGYAAFLGVWVMGLGLPIACGIYFSDVSPLVSVFIIVFIILAFISLVIFSFTSIFFSRVAVLRGFWPDKIFYYSYKLIKGYVLRFIIYSILISIFGMVLVYILNAFIGIPLGLFIAYAKVDALQAILPFSIITNGLASFFYTVSITVYFLNMDYILNRDNKKMEIFARAAAIHDTSMPVLK